MNKNLIIKNYLKIIDTLQKHNQSYYEKNNPIISDQQYDILKKKIIDLESENKFLRSKDSPSQSVGFKPSKNFQKIKHKVPMLSLGNAFNEEDLKKLLKNTIKQFMLKRHYTD